MPGARQPAGIRRRPGERERLNLGLRIACSAGGVLEDCGWAETRILPAGRPRQVAQWLQPLVARDDIDPIARLQATDQREDLVGRQIERMQREAELRMLDERKEAKGVFASLLLTL